MLPGSILLASVALLACPGGPAAGGGREIREVKVAMVGDRLLKVDDAPGEPAAADGLVAPRPAPGKVLLARENFDEIVFKNAWIPRVRRPHLHYVLDYRIGQVAERRPLTELERRQLQLAGSGDIQRFFDRVEAARADFEAARTSFRGGMAELGRLDALALEFRQGPFGAGSVYAKTLARFEKGKD